MQYADVIKAITVLAVMIGVAIGSTNSVYAARECVQNYGGGETCVDKDGDLEVNKKIKNPRTGDFEDHIKPSGGSNPYTFKASQTITFSIVVKNTGDIRIENIKLEDILPSYVKYRSGDGDGKNDNSKVVFDEFDLNPDEEEEFEFTAKVSSDGILPKDKRICLTNVAKAKGELEDSNEKVDDSDSADFCVELPKVLGKESPKVLPRTGGSEDENRQKLAYMILAGSISAGLVLVGFGLKKIAETK